MNTSRTSPFSAAMIIAAVMVLQLVTVQVAAGVEKGVFRSTIHWGVPAKWFDPSFTDLRAPVLSSLYVP